MSFNSIKIVLVRAENSANIGAASRAMKNFGFKDLILVNAANHKTEDAYTLGWKAKDILNRAKVHKNLKSALKNSSLTVGFTRRAGRHRGAGRLLSDLTGQILEASSGGNIYLVFGNEKNGLSNDELKYCDELVTIPTTNAYPSMNLSHAVAVALYAIFSETKKGKIIHKKPDEFYATPKEFELLMKDFESSLIYLGYTEIPKPKIIQTTLQNIRNLFKKNVLEKREYHLFRAFLSRVMERKVGNTGRKAASQYVLTKAENHVQTRTKKSLSRAQV